MKKSFTLIEILVVATIIALLAAGASVSYSQLNKQSRDAKRKTDLEQIRGALEMYRSNSTDGKYPTGNWSNLSVLTGSPKYIQSLPTDPKNPTYVYYYSSSDGLDYTLAAQLETTSSCTSPPGGNSCGTGNPCNYCLGPYGKK